VIVASNRGYQRETNKEGGEGEIREAGREDAPQTSGTAEEEGEAQQDDQLLGSD
jgi:hypothetical protein